MAVKVDICDGLVEGIEPLVKSSYCRGCSGGTGVRHDDKDSIQGGRHKLDDLQRGDQYAQ